MVIGLCFSFGFIDVACLVDLILLILSLQVPVGSAAVNGFLVLLGWRPVQLHNIVVFGSNLVLKLAHFWNLIGLDLASIA